MAGYKKAVCAAFPHTIPVLTGYLFSGVAFGILMQSKGFGFLWSGVMSLVVYAGSMQFVTANLLTVKYDLLAAAFMTCMVNARHIFYGFSLLDTFRNMGRKKPYLIFTLTDETFSLLCAVPPPNGVKKDEFYFAISALNHLYWIAGSMLGGLAGALLPINPKGIEFMMTALFVVTFTQQFRQIANRIPALIGLLGSGLCLVLFGPQRFILPAMLLLVVILTLFRETIERAVDA